MKKISFAPLMAVLVPLVLVVWAVFGWQGLFPEAFAEHPVLKFSAYAILMTHLTITCMSLCFHRMHTHQGVVLHKSVDRFMQTWLWAVTSMSKLDWTSVHIYHHAHSDQALDPHSPVQKGLAHVALLGALDYTVARQSAEVLKVRARIPEDGFEHWLDQNLLVGPSLLTAAMLICFGPFWGVAISLFNFALSPIFAVGGVNALAHYAGYRNYATRDNSRNIGLMLFPLNWMVCGELDHNNHHAKPRSASFRHRWFEVDIGYIYLWCLERVGLASIKEAVTPSKLAAWEKRAEIASQLEPKALKASA